jgi:hypothetical protein
MPETESPIEPKQQSAIVGAILGIVMIPVLLIGACFAIPYIFILRWMRHLREHSFNRRMRSSGRLITWADFLCAMRGSGGTCIEERFSPKGPVRFWWTPENVYGESPHEIIDWFTMRKGGRFEPFIRWCRARYTSADGGSAVLVDTALVAKRDIYALWSECKGDTAASRWVEVAPPEILARKPGA